MVLEDPTKKKMTSWVHRLGVGSRWNEKKNDNGKCSVCRHGFRCCNTRKKAKMTSLVSEVLALKKKLGR